MSITERFKSIHQGTQYSELFQQMPTHPALCRHSHWPKRRRGTKTTPGRGRTSTAHRKRRYFPFPSNFPNKSRQRVDRKYFSASDPTICAEPKAGVPQIIIGGLPGVLVPTNAACPTPVLLDGLRMSGGPRSIPLPSPPPSWETRDTSEGLLHVQMHRKSNLRRCPKVDPCPWALVL